MRYAATKPRTSSLYGAIVADNVNRLEELLKKIGLSDSNFMEKSISIDNLSRLQYTIVMVSQLDQSKSGHETTLETFFDFVASAVDKRKFLKRVGEIVSKDETGGKLPEEIRIVLKESDLESKIAKQIEGLSRGQLVTLIRRLTADKKNNLAIIDYKRFRAVIRAIQNTNLIPHNQLCCIMLGSLLT
jgi:hypothetical protein